MVFQQNHELSKYSIKGLETNCTMRQVLDLRSGIKINENNEKMVEISAEAFAFCNPHPYLEIGAPYKSPTEPFSLREGVLDRLIRAAEKLDEILLLLKACCLSMPGGMRYGTGWR